MQDAMAIWDSICHSQWFKTTSIVSPGGPEVYPVQLLIHVTQILFLNKLDLFTEKIQHSDIKSVFPDYDGLLICGPTPRCHLLMVTQGNQRM
jgi:guanine nucleotide-binding protein subunit alpha